MAAGRGLRWPAVESDQTLSAIARCLAEFPVVVAECRLFGSLGVEQFSDGVELFGDDGVEAARKELVGDEGQHVTDVGVPAAHEPMRLLVVAPEPKSITLIPGRAGRECSFAADGPNHRPTSPHVPRGRKYSPVGR